MASNVSVQKSRGGGLKWNKQPVEQEVQKKVSKNLPATKLKVNKQPTCNSEQEPRRKKKASKDLSTTEPAPKRARKTLNKKERKDLGDYLKSVDDDVLMFAVRSKLLEQPFPDTTNDSIEALFENKERFSCNCYPGNVLQFRRLRVAKYWANTDIFGFAFAVIAIT